MSQIDRNASLARQLEDLMERSAQGLWNAERQCAEQEAHVPAMDLYETEEWLSIELELPGVRREAIEVFVEGQTLTVSAMKTDAGPCSDPAGSKVDYQQVERKYGRFYREVRLPISCNTRDCRAHYQNGILHLEFKKLEDRRGERRRINIE